MQGHNSRQSSVASAEAVEMLKSILPYGSGVPAEHVERPELAMDDMTPEDDSSVHSGHRFESSHDHDAHHAAEKHAYLHSLHGLEDSVF